VSKAKKPLDAHLGFRVGDRVRVGKDRGTVYELPHRSGKYGLGITVSFPGEELPCVCEPEQVKFVSRPRKREPLDARTLRVMARRYKARCREILAKLKSAGNTNAYSVGRALELDMQGDNLRSEASAIERKAKASKGGGK